MKRTTLLLFGLIGALALSAEKMPAGYYDAINNKKGAAIKTALCSIIGGGERYEYGSPSGKPATWTAFPITDIESDGTIWDMYSNIKRYPPLNGLSAASLDIEHMLPNSWWGGKTGSKEAFSDLYLLSPADHQTNMNKSNYPPGQLADSNKVNNGIFFMGQDPDFGGLAFDVIDEYKGDFARAYFYTATAYENLSSWDYTKYSKYITNSPQFFTDHLRDVLLEWHRNDPVSEKEVNRLDAVSSIQHNRNPFIEYPDLVEYIWGNKTNTKVKLANLQCTTNGTYEFPVSPTNPLAHEATQISKNGFLANWSNTGSASYELDVFTRTESGKNDTLLAMWAMNGDAIKNHTDTLTFHQEDGTQITSTQNLTDGAAAIILKATDNQRYFLIKNINFKTKAAELVVKCAISRDDKTPQQMSVYREDNNTLIKTITLSANDSFPRFTIPKGTKQIKITSPSGNRVSVHQLFIVRGDYKVTETSIAGYPKTVNGLSYQVETAMSSSEPLYYHVTPAGLRTTNTVKVDYDPSTATEIEEISSQQSEFSIQKLLRNGQLIILRDGVMYNAQGARIE